MLNSKKRVLSQTENVPTQRKRRATLNPKQVRKINGETCSKIKVMLRCRGHNNLKNAILEPVPTNPDTKVLLKTNNTIYNFDRVFDQNITQQKVYEAVAEPVLKEVLKGYNCTIFAYGQTGTGKTYTMEGEMSEEAGGYGAKAGIIPRTINQLFTELEKMDPENHVMVSMLELYNEELRDLLCFSDDPKPLNIFEDGTGVVVQGIKEHAITSVERGIDLMKSGVKKRMTASTNINDKSSRSHSIFTITVYLRETGQNGEKTFRVGKLNLVDLAGSENSRSSGSEQLRAREAANINRSLLTLGRVVNSLVDNSPHIPYRESKLTRLLKDSLGGHTKTYIIATVSPKQQTFEELKSTLDYANHANGICNKPQANIPISSEKRVSTLIHNLEQMDYDLQMNYDRNGVYQSKKAYDTTRQELQSAKEALQSKEEEIQTLRNNLQKSQSAAESALKEKKEYELQQQKIQHQMQKEFGEQLAQVETKAEKEIALWKTRHTELLQGLYNFKNDMFSNWQSFFAKYK